MKLPDGGQVSLDWYASADDNQKKEKDAIAIIIPGLTGNSQTEYVKSLVPEVQSCGYTCVGFNQRSRGGTRLLTPRLYCAANCDDLEHALRLIRSKRPETLIVAVGISLGGIQLTRYLVSKGSASDVDAAVLISAIFNLVQANESLEKFGINYLFNRMLTKGLLNIMHEERDMLQKADGIRYEDVLQSRTLRELDGHFTAKMFGFSSAVDYYTAASNAGKLHQVKVPTLCLSSADDVFSPADILPTDEIAASSHVTMVLTKSGGHIGFMDGLLPRLPFYSERLVAQYLTALLSLPDVRTEFQ